jgi:hypothetical protein
MGQRLGCDLEENVLTLAGKASPGTEAFDAGLEWRPEEDPRGRMVGRLVNPEASFPEVGWAVLPLGQVHRRKLAAGRHIQHLRLHLLALALFGVRWHP